MKKKVLVLLVVAVLAVAPAMAADYRGSTEDGSVGVGINLGTNTGLGLKFGMGKFDIFADVGLDAWHISSDGFGLGGDVGVSYEVYDIDLGGKHHMPITVGLMVPMGFFFGNNSVSLGIRMIMSRLGTPFAVFRTTAGLDINDGTHVKDTRSPP